MRLLRITNTTRGTVLGDRIELANNIFTRVQGLMGRRGLEAGGGLLIVPCASIHSMWMRFPFDAVFLDKQHRVVHVIAEMGAWRFSPHFWKAHSTLELPAATAAATQTQPGDQLAVEPVPS